MLPSENSSFGSGVSRSLASTFRDGRILPSRSTVASVTTGATSSGKPFDSVTPCDFMRAVTIGQSRTDINLASGFSPSKTFSTWFFGKTPLPRVSLDSSIKFFRSRRLKRPCPNAPSARDARQYFRVFCNSCCMILNRCIRENQLMVQRKSIL